MKNSMAKIKVIKNEENPEPTEVLAEAVIRISENLQKLEKSGLNKRAIVVLVHDYTKVAKRDIELILESLAVLKGWYCR